MAVTTTLNSLKSKLNLELVDTMDNRLQKAIENVTTVSPNSNNILTLNPNLSTMFKTTLSSNTTIALGTPETVYNVNGSTLALLLTLTSNNVELTFPSSVKWQNETVPTFGSVNVITFITFDAGVTWYASCVVGSSDFE